MTHEQARVAAAQQAIQTAKDNGIAAARIDHRNDSHIKYNGLASTYPDFAQATLKAVAEGAYWAQWHELESRPAQ
jgi:hypothetical protein